MVQTLNRNEEFQCPNRRMFWYWEMPFCELNDKHCLLDTDGSCEIYDAYLKEVESEKVMGV